jgi:hypothetical protein
MRKLLAGLVISLFAALAVPSLALGTHSNGQGPDKDFVNGAAKGTLVTPCGPRPGHFHTNGQSRDPVTNLGTGQFWTTIDINPPCLGFTSAEFSGDVICVNGYLGPPGEENSGIWRGIVTEVLLNPGGVPGIPGILAPGSHVFSRHIDNGSPGTADSAFGFATNAAFAGGGCPPLNIATLLITQGNLLVHDGI